MPFVPDQASSGGYFEPDEEKSLAGFGKNLVSDVKGTAQSLFGPGGLGQRLMEHPVDTTVDTIKGIPSAVINEGKRLGAGELLTGHPINAVEKFGQAAYDKPLTTGLDVLPALGAAGKALGIGGEAAKTGELAAQSAKLAPVAEEAAGIIPGAKTGPVHALFDYNDPITKKASYQIYGDPELHGYKTTPNVPLETLQEKGIPVVGKTQKAIDLGHEAPKVVPIGGEEPATEPISRMPPDPNAPTPNIPPTQTKPNDPIQELKNYIGPKVEAAKGKIGGIYEQQSAKPGWSNSVADYLQGKSQMMAAQDLGATPFQARQAGHEAMRAIGQYAIDNDIVSPTNGLRGMRAQNAKLLNQAGETIGQLRKEADALRDPVKMPVDVLQEVRNRLDAKYARGAYSGQGGQYAKALEDVADSDASFEGAAKTATKLNQAANEAAKIKQPHGPYTDVANAISDINNERIKQLLGQQKATQYEKALRDFGVNKKISSFLDRKAGGEVKRIGPGSFTSNMIQKGMDELGYKVGARALNKTSTAVLKNPGIAKTLPSLFKQFIHDVDIPEPEAMAHGGIVGLNDFLASKYGKTKEMKPK